MQLKHIFYIVAVLFLTGCSKFLDVQPRDLQTSSQLFATKPGFYMASTGVYDAIASNELYGRAMTYELVDVLAKRYAVRAASTYFTELARNPPNYAFQSVAPVLSNIWEKAYSTILAANLLIDNAKVQSGILTQNESNVLQGEMLAVRAFLHLDMLRLFGPRYITPAGLAIPYNDKSEVSVLPLLTFDQVINNIIRDLGQAEILLANDPVIANGPMASVSPNESVYLRYRQFRFNIYSVKALKARAYLYADKKVEALATAKALLADPKLHQHFPAVNPNAVGAAAGTAPDRVFSSEVLTSAYVRTRDEAYSRYFSPETAGINFLQPHETFVTTRLFMFNFAQVGGTSETQDFRFQSQWEPASGVNVKGHAFVKYKGISRPVQFDETSEYFYSKMIPLIRLSEVYYIAAESEPNVEDGFGWLNQMRPRRGLTAIASSEFASLTASFPRLLHNEYLREFYGEGQAFFFAKRRGYAIPSTENGMAVATIGYTDAAYRLPLPIDELK